MDSKFSTVERKDDLKSDDILEIKKGLRLKQELEILKRAMTIFAIK